MLKTEDEVAGVLARQVCTGVSVLTFLWTVITGPNSVSLNTVITVENINAKVLWFLFIAVPNAPRWIRKLY